MRQNTKLSSSGPRKELIHRVGSQASSEDGNILVNNALPPLKKTQTDYFSDRAFFSAHTASSSEVSSGVSSERDSAPQSHGS